MKAKTIGTSSMIVELSMTDEQVKSITYPVEQRYKLIVAKMEKNQKSRLAAVKKRTEYWKDKYSFARKQLLEAANEIQALKKRLKDGDWEGA